MTDQKKPDVSESSIARMAGNIAAGLVTNDAFCLDNDAHLNYVARRSVELSRIIAKELTETRPPV